MIEVEVTRDCDASNEMRRKTDVMPQDVLRALQQTFRYRGFKNHSVHSTL